MAISKKQKELDALKWRIGEENGFDPCGMFAYCERCKKEQENPCEKALKRYLDSNRKKRKRLQNKQIIEGLQFRATVVEKKD